MPAVKVMLLMSEVWTLVEPRDLRSLVALAPIAEEAGIDGLMIGEHVVLGAHADRNGVPANPRDWLGEGTHPRDYAHPNGLHLLSGMAAVTSRIRLLAAALLTPFRHPLVIGKELATLDLMSEGRLIFLPSVGWQEEEYQALGVPFHQRGQVLDEQLAIWDAAWREDPVTYHGRHYSFDEVSFEPKAWRPEGPAVWIGGDRLHRAALRRLLRFGSGYLPVMPPSPDDLALLRSSFEEAGRSFEDLELVAILGLDTPFPDATSTKPLGPALDGVSQKIADGFTTFILKPSQYIDDPAQFGEFCHEAIGGIGERAGEVG